MKFSGIIKRGSYDVIIPYAGRKVQLAVPCRGKGDGHIYLQLVGLKKEGTARLLWYKGEGVYVASGQSISDDDSSLLQGGVITVFLDTP